MIKRTLLATAIAVSMNAHAAPEKTISLEQIGTLQTGVFDDGAAEIVAYDAIGYRLFVINAAESTVDVVDISDPTDPQLVGVIDVAPDIAANTLGTSGGVNSVAVREGLVAIAVENDDKQANGWVAFYDTEGVFLGVVEAGPLPDSVVITNNGRYVLAANEGEPSDDYLDDPEGSVTVINISRGIARASVATADFRDFTLADITGGARTPRAAEIPPFSTVAQDLSLIHI